MCDPFGLDCALQPFVGNSLVVAGAILGIIATVTIMVCMELLFSISAKHGRSTMGTWPISAMIGFIISVIVGWIPVWVPFLIVFVIAWMLLDPMGSRAAHG